jgi:hypothetical protein
MPTQIKTKDIIEFYKTISDEYYKQLKVFRI